MANYATLKAAINAVIRANGNKEITGTVLNEALTAMVNSLGANYQFAGVATPSTNPGTPDQNVFYIAGEAGTYTNFNNIVLPDGVSVLKWNGSWSSETVVAGDGVFDISAYKATGGTLATFADLSAALDGGNNIPSALRKGGMMVKFIQGTAQSSDNTYVQYRLMTSSFSVYVKDWQGIDEIFNVEPNFRLIDVVPESDRNYCLIKSDGTLHRLTGDDYDTSPKYDLKYFRTLVYSNLWNGGGFVGLCLYDENDAVVLTKNGSGTIDLSEYPTAKYIRFCGSRNSTYCEITLKGLLDSNAVLEEIDDIERNLKENYLNKNDIDEIPTIGSNNVVKSDGLYDILNVDRNFRLIDVVPENKRNYGLLKADGTLGILLGDIYDTSPKLKLIGIRTIIYNNLWGGGLNFVGLCLYDENDAVVLTKNGSGTIDLSEYPTAKYIRFCGSRNSTYCEITLKGLLDSNAVLEEIDDIEKEIEEDYVTNYLYVGQSELYQTIQDAVSSISDNSIKNRYIIIVREGIYDISNAGINNIPIKPWVKIQGESRRVKVIFTSQSYDAHKNVFDVEQGFDGYAEICNMSFETAKVKGTLHLDSSNWQGEICVHDCNIYTIENEQPFNPNADYFLYMAASLGSVNIATHRNQVIRIENIVTNGYIYSHTETNGLQDLNAEPSKFIVRGCVCDWIGIYDNGSKVRKQAIIENNKCNFIKISCSNAYNYNFMQWDVVLNNNNCKFVQGLFIPYNSSSTENLWDAFYNHKMIFADSNLHRMVKNKTGSAIGRGQKVVFTNHSCQTIQLGTDDNYDAITCQTIDNGDFGIIQSGGDLEYYWNYIQSHSFEQS